MEKQINDFFLDRHFGQYGEEMIMLAFDLLLKEEMTLVDCYLNGDLEGSHLIIKEFSIPSWYYLSIFKTITKSEQNEVLRVYESCLLWKVKTKILLS